MNKSDCKKCKKTYTNKTLNKRNGVCGRCFNLNGITKKNIPKIIKEKTWMLHIGDKAHGKCWVCKKKITMANFQAGHIKSEYGGGQISVDNLRPVCKSCNVKTGVFDMGDIKKALTSTIKDSKLECSSCKLSVELVYTSHNLCDKCFERVKRNYSKNSGFIDQRNIPNEFRDDCWTF
jgi:hypothetical protein